MHVFPGFTEKYDPLELTKAFKSKTFFFSETMLYFQNSVITVE